MAKIYDALLEEARLDLEAAKALIKTGHYSQTLYLVEQCLEKSYKGLYSYLEITRNKTDDDSINANLMKFGHNNTKMIPQIYHKICKFEDKEIDNIPETTAEVMRVKRLMKEKLAGLKKSVENLVGKPPTDQKELLKVYPAKIYAAYNEYKKFEPFIKQKASDILKENNLTGTETATQPHAFELFFGISRLLFPCIFLKNDIYRYPFKEYNYENLQILDKDEMRNPCSLLIEMTGRLFTIVPRLMKQGLLALA